MTPNQSRPEKRIISFVFMRKHLFVYINYIKNLQEDFKTRFKDLLNMENPGLFLHLMLQ